MIFRSDDIITKTVARILIPFIQLYALYVLMHGHYSPGGGFQGGVILAASVVLFFLTYGYKEAKKHLSETLLTFLSSLGLLIYSGIGLLCVFFMGNYLDYGKLSVLLHVSPAHARSLGILGVEIGIALAVMAVMISIFFDISSGGVLPEDEEEKHVENQKP
jgi:multicomponent Na+:H+ antiporter subunit B